MTGISSACGACKFLRRRCTNECISVPYYCYEQAATHFAAVHKLFGASNVSKLLSHLPMQGRSDAAMTISYEALARVQDPIYGCIAHIFALQQQLQVASLEEEIESIGIQMANLGAGILPYDTTPYFAAQSDITSNCTDQQGLPMLHSQNALVNKACNDYNALQLPRQDYEQECLDLTTFERLLEELEK